MGPGFRRDDQAMNAAIIGVGQSAYTRHPQPGQSVHTFIRDAVVAALKDAEIDATHVDGMAVASFSLAPDTAVDLAWRLGLSLNWLLQDTNGGSSAMNMLGHALRGVETGAASVILVVGGDATGLAGYGKVAANFNIATREHLAPLGHGGPNGVYALVTSRQMKTYGLQKSDYGHIAIAQRAWAANNPYAVYRTPMTMEEYLNAPMVADPLSRYDCVPVVAGAQAIVIAHPDRVPRGRAPVRVRAHRASFNYDNQAGDGLQTGISTFAGELWQSGRRAARRHRRREPLRRLSHHGAGAGERPRLRRPTTISSASRAIRSASDAFRSTPGAACCRPASRADRPAGSTASPRPCCSCSIAPASGR